MECTVYVRRCCTIHFFPLSHKTCGPPLFARDCPILSDEEARPRGRHLQCTLWNLRTLGFGHSIYGLLVSIAKVLL